MFKRKIYDTLLSWKTESAGKTAVLIEGARRVGKTTIAREFAQNEYESCIFIDFARAPQSVLRLFDDISDLNYLFLQLQLQYHVDLTPRKSVIVFDEVQLCPRARQAIKYLVQDHRYDFIETGSLISIRKNVKDIVIPSEERKISMYPMDYEEFLWALGDTATYGLIRKCFESGKPIGQQANRTLLRNFRLYMLIGGMPQAVREYIDSNNFRLVDDVKRDILNLYEDDFNKVDQTGRAAKLFDAIPAQLNGNSSRYHVSSVIKSARAEDILKLVSEMENSRTILLSHHVSDPNTGLAANKSLEQFKMFVCDTGLFTTLMFKDKSFTENIVYEKLLNDKLPANLGYLYENMVAQMLTSNGDGLYYYTFRTDNRSHLREIDFLITRGSKICPIEVKSSRIDRHVSLDEFCAKYSSRILKKYIIHTKDFSKDKDIICSPIYTCPFI